MNIQLGTPSSEATFTNAIVSTSRTRTSNTFTLLDGSKKVQEAVTISRVFTVVLVNPTSGEVTNVEAEFDKEITLNFIFKSVTYTVKFKGSLIKSTGSHKITFTLQEV